MLPDETKNCYDAYVCLQNQKAKFTIESLREMWPPPTFDISEGKQQVRVPRFSSTFRIPDANWRDLSFPLCTSFAQAFQLYSVAAFIRL